MTLARQSAKTAAGLTAPRRQNKNFPFVRRKNARGTKRVFLFSAAASARANGESPYARQHKNAPRGQIASRGIGFHCIIQF